MVSKVVCHPTLKAAVPFAKGSTGVDRVAERNPVWARDDLILALDLYLRHRPAVPGKSSTAVIELSDTLNRLGRADRRRSPTHRNPNGVAMKLLNFRSLDPDYTATGKVGLHHTSRGDGEVWREFAPDPIRLRRTAAAISAAIAAEAMNPRTVEDADEKVAQKRGLRSCF
jgi:hypothetical protein